jgi:glutamate 5-kinase
MYGFANSRFKTQVSSAGSSLGTGGMSTKLIAARLGTSAGVTVIITRSSNPGNILNIVNYLYSSPGSSSPEHGVEEDFVPSSAALNLMAASTGSSKPPLHTRFLPSSDPIRDRHFWLLHTINPHGTVYIDQGAHRALLNKAGLLPAGVVDVEGSFSHHEAVRLVVVRRLSEPGPDGKLWVGTGEEVGRALVNYASAEISRILGHHTSDIQPILGYADSEYVVNRAHIVFYRGDSRPATPIQTFRRNSDSATPLQI